MSRGLEWRMYIDNETGDFELAKYLYHSITDLMKNTLDMGTLLSEDNQRLRAYREQIKTMFKGRWMEVAQVLEYYDIIVPCVCTNEFCKICGGARYRINSAMSMEELQEFAIVVSEKFAEGQDGLAVKLEEGLRKALEEVSNADLPTMQ